MYEALMYEALMCEALMYEALPRRAERGFGAGLSIAARVGARHVSGFRATRLLEEIPRMRGSFSIRGRT